MVNLINAVVLQARLTADPVLNHTENDIPVCTVTLACDQNHKDADGNRGCDFIDVTFWRKNAEFLSGNFSKGSVVIVKGCLTQRRWTDKDGNKRQKLIVTASSVEFPK